MMLFCADNGVLGKRVDARNGEELSIRLEITKADLQNIGDGFWKIKVANFNSEDELTAELKLDW